MGLIGAFVRASFAIPRLRSEPAYSPRSQSSQHPHVPRRNARGERGEQGRARSQIRSAPIIARNDAPLIGERAAMRTPVRRGSRQLRHANRNVGGVRRDRDARARRWPAWPTWEHAGWRRVGTAPFKRFATTPSASRRRARRRSSPNAPQLAGEAQRKVAMSTPVRTGASRIERRAPRVVTARRLDSALPPPQSLSVSLSRSVASSICHLPPSLGRVTFFMRQRAALGNKSD